MDKACSNFVEELTKQSDILQIAMTNVYKYWEPEEPPVTILFAELGRALAKYFNRLEGKVKLFETIEGAMLSDNELLVTAVASGLIEAMVAEGEQIGNFCDSIGPQLGAHSRSHAKSWRGL